ncbi:formylglycine-generating enzyme family protein [Candidatus Hydrogenedentota bacterium]
MLRRFLMVAVIFVLVLASVLAGLIFKFEALQFGRGANKSPVTEGHAGLTPKDADTPEPKSGGEEAEGKAARPAPEGPKKGDTGTFAGIDFVWVEAGTFTMGSPSDEINRGPDEGPQHSVTISKGFWMGKYEVTQNQWQSEMGHNPSSRKGDDNPVENVNWNDAQDFIKKLNAKEQGHFRLPTEAEWEYVCRAGTSTAYSFGSSSSDLGSYAWYKDNAWDVGEKYAHRVGQKKPNPWGLYDMYGNAKEWCQDWWEWGGYSPDPQVDPTGPSSGLSRVLRGGSFSYGDGALRSANRDTEGLPDYSGGYFGFRVVRIE